MKISYIYIYPAFYNSRLLHLSMRKKLVIITLVFFGVIRGGIIQGCLYADDLGYSVDNRQRIHKDLKAVKVSSSNYKDIYIVPGIYETCFKKNKYIIITSQQDLDKCVQINDPVDFSRSNVLLIYIPSPGGGYSFGMKEAYEEKGILYILYDYKHGCEEVMPPDRIQGILIPKANSTVKIIIQHFNDCGSTSVKLGIQEIAPELMQLE